MCGDSRVWRQGRVSGDRAGCVETEQGMETGCVETVETEQGVETGQGVCRQGRVCGDSGDRAGCVETGQGVWRQDRVVQNVMWWFVQVWTMYAYMMKKLQQGYTSVLIRDGDFYYSFFLWFEDSMVSSCYESSLHLAIGMETDPARPLVWKHGAGC